MCFGGSQPQAPQIKYEGPSDSQIKANEQALNQYRTDMAAQQSSFQSQLQEQIDAANAETARLQDQYAADLEAAKNAAAGDTAKAKSGAASAVGDAQSAAAAAVSEAGAMANLQQVGAYKVGASQSEPVAAQTTAAMKKKDKPKSTLKISSAALPTSAGTGLNIGV